MVANKRIKPTAITRAGYEYQDLVGIEMLIRHYRDPELYEWVEVEANQQNAKALDDVVALRKDGSVEYVQVKFTVNSEEYFLDWDWLLSKKASGTSMLEKWARSFRNAKTYGPIHKAQLKTNRIPSDSFAACMENNKIQLDKLDEQTKKLVETECGGANNASDFFSSFEFSAAMPDFEHFEVQLRDQLVPSDTDQAGWLLLKDNVTRWAVLKNEPFPDGRIQRDHIVRLISKKRPKPIRQDFIVPPGYAVPDEGIDREIDSRLKCEATPLTILWGTPGRGKSTFLSHLVQRLQAEGEIVVRHHYFLSSEENSSNRASFVDIAASLINQLVSSFPHHTSGLEDDPEKLRDGLCQVARSLGREGKRLYLIVDGLDHVYRDSSRIDQLDHLFNVIFPIPEHLTLVVGTQRVPDDQLPQKLLVNATDDDWVEMPKMNEAAVGNWLRSQNDARHISLKWEDRKAEELDKIARAFFEISGGHPLHLIYAFEGLIRSGKKIDEADVRALPPCPDGDIRNYYSSLWLRISPPAKQILHMLAGSGFHWPANGVRKCMGDFHEIEFLLEPHNSGMKPFHESIFAWLRSRNDHKEQYRLLLPKIVDWLKDDAPEYWRWGWLWLTQAENGDPSDLVHGADAKWAAGSLAKGWPERQIANIFSVAERYTFEAGDLSATIRLRSIKTRVLNARKYQSLDFGKFLSSALAISENHQQALNLLDDLPLLSSDEIVALARYGPNSIQVDVREACRIELARRINTWIELRHRTGDDFITLTHRYLEVAALFGKSEAPNVLSFLKSFKKPGALLRYYVNELSKLHDLEALVEVAGSFKKGRRRKLRIAIDRKILRSALFLGAEPREFMGLHHSGTSADIGFWFLKNGIDLEQEVDVTSIPVDLMRERINASENDDLADFFHQSFFVALNFGLQVGTAISLVYPPHRRGNLGFIDDALDCIEKLASDLIAGNLPWEFSSAFISSAEVPEVRFSGQSETRYAHYLGFRKALWRIAFDTHLFGLTNKTASHITQSEFEIARASVHWNDDIWLEKNAGVIDPSIDAAAAKTLLLDLTDELSDTVTEFHERADTWTNLALFSYLNQVGDPLALLRRAASCLLAYGYRKDMSIFDILDCIKYVHEADETKARLWIKKVAPIVSQITEFTDGDETRHARSEMISVIAKTCPYWLQSLHAYHLSVDEWYLADECLKQFVNVMSLKDSGAAALCGTLIDPYQLSALEKRIDCEPTAKRLLEKQVEFLGGRPLQRERGYNTPDSPLNDREKTKLEQDPCKFKATDFTGLVSSISGHEFPFQHRKDHLVRWLRHWQSEKKARIALKSIWEALEDPNFSSVADEVLDEAFQVSLTSEGKKAAYKWLVVAHIYRHGWASYWTSSEEVEHRLRSAAETYPNDWFKFVRDSSTPNPRYANAGTSFSVGTKRLVRFLIFVRQTEAAISIVESLIDDLVLQTQDQPIPELTWLN